jgi:hypothetical protein
MDDLLTTKEIKTAMGLTENDATAAYIHGLSDFMAVCKAQSAKTKAALVAEGWLTFDQSATMVLTAVDYERARIVGLFDAAYHDGGNRDRALLLRRFERIIEGLREKK